MVDSTTFPPKYSLPTIYQSTWYIPKKQSKRDQIRATGRRTKIKFWSLSGGLTNLGIKHYFRSSVPSGSDVFGEKTGMVVFGIGDSGQTEIAYLYVQKKKKKSSNSRKTAISERFGGVFKFLLLVMLNLKSSQKIGAGAVSVHTVIGSNVKRL